MNGIEVTYCKMIDTYYQGIVSTVDLALTFPNMIAKRIMVYIRRLESNVLASIEKALLAIIEQIGNLKAFKKFNKNKKIKAFCDALFRCRAAIDMLVSIGTISQEDATDIQKFEQLVCRVGLSDFIKNYLGSLMAQYKATASNLLEKANDAIEQLFDKLINPYQAYLMGQTAFPGTTKKLTLTIGQKTCVGVVEIMELLNAFGECGFALCDFVTTAANKQEDWKTNMKIDSSGNFASKWMEGVDNKMNKINDLFNSINTSADNFFEARADEVEAEFVAKDWV